MPSLSQSPILQALGYAIANSLWQMAMVWIVYVLLNSIFKFRSEIKYRIAVAAQVIGFGWFIVTLQFYYKQCSQALLVAENLYYQSGDQNTVIFDSEQGSLLSYFIKAEQVLPYLSVAYLLLLAFLVVRWFRAYRYTQLVRLRGLHKIDVDWKLFVTRVAGQMGIKQKVRIYLSEIVQSPVTIGFLKPVILVPIASINHLTPQQLEAVILHELAHIKRHDYLLNIVLSIIEIGLFFNPFTRLITKSVSKERENSCDDWVLQYQYNPSMYAEALLRIAVLQKSPAMAMHAVKTKGELLSRVQRMVHQKDNRFNYRHQLIALLMMTGILTSIAWFDPSAMRAQDTRTAEAQAVVLEPLPAKVDNPLFNPVFFLNASLKEEVKKTVEKANQKQIGRLKKDLRTANREIVLPQVMAPVAIENLKELEKNIASVNKDIRKNLFQHIPSQLKLAQGHVFHFDTMRFNGNITFNDNMSFFTQQENYFQNMVEEIQKSQKALEDALKKGVISKIDARKMQSDIADAMKSLKEMNLPQVYGFAPHGNGAELFYRNGIAMFDNDSEKEKTKNSEERRKPGQGDARSSSTTKLRKEITDTLKQRIINRTATRAPHQPEVHVTSSGGTHYIMVDGKTAGYVRTLPPGAGVSIALQTPPVQPVQSQDLAGYTYTYNESGDECEKANKNEKSRRFTTFGKQKIVPVKPKKKTNCNSCTSTTTSNQQKQNETVVTEVEFQ